MTVLMAESDLRRSAQVLVHSARSAVLPMARAELVDDLIRTLLRYRNGTYEAEEALAYVAAVATMGLERALAKIGQPAAVMGD